MAAPQQPSIRDQAAQAADAAVPTVKSIYGQYGQSMQDAGGFTQALMHILSQQPGIGAAYNSAISQQQAVGNAATNRIAAVTGGMPTAAPSVAATGGLADSALSHLIANQGAARAYGATLPIAAAARGALENQSLITARNQALQTRAQQREQAFNSALGQAQQNALALREFNVNTGLKQQSLALQQANENAINTEKYAALAQNSGQFNAKQAQQWQEFQAKLRTSLSPGGSSLPGFTPSEISGLSKRASAYVQGVAILHGDKIGVTIQNLMAQGIPRQLAVYEANEGYATMTAPQQSDPAFNPKGVFNAQGFQAAMGAYRKAVGSFTQWVNQRKFQTALNASRFRKSPPGHPE